MWNNNLFKSNNQKEKMEIYCTKINLSEEENKKGLSYLARIESPNGIRFANGWKKGNPGQISRLTIGSSEDSGTNPFWELNVKRCSSEDRGSGKRIESFFGKVQRVYEGNQSNFWNFLDIALMIQGVPSESSLSRLGISGKVYSVYRDNFKRIFLIHGIPKASSTIR